jgi:hypothetical protein
VKKAENIRKIAQILNAIPASKLSYYIDMASLYLNIMNYKKSRVISALFVKKKKLVRTMLAEKLLD